MKLKRWDTGEVIFEMECSTFRELVEGATKEEISFYRADMRYANMRGANMRGADMSGANMSGANMRYADMSGADMSGVVGNSKELKSMQLEKYMIVFTSDILCIGCQQHTIEEWASFTDKKISKMDDGALEWWNKWKDFIFTAIEMTKEA